jgi:hypothetical protein
VFVDLPRQLPLKEVIEDDTDEMTGKEIKRTP